ncbi:hypothetical protein [Nonomuraea rubra]|uniref:Creatinine amidohydrolase/Fe(II)-dependent formamide hydrolase-like protein n=1 Tax=Nonomuraea rubra TaxID=46180 RepID=A0A7X0U5V1_9ACTN|nr:hypothetical protein [Nonomuraea rubra]MBB6555885.1 creatinine amidohydrolase/Fe(II)-dependent formamide hydrolase-like protein [Nonomuraea rubra]
MIKSHPARAKVRDPWLVMVLIVLTIVFSSGYGVMAVAANEGLCQKRANYENALVRKALSPVLSHAGLVGSMEDQSDCDSSTYGSYVYVSIENVKPENVVAAFAKAGWSSGPASERTRDCAAGCDAYDLTKKFGERIVNVLVEGAHDVEILASAADDCWDADGYRCVDG